VFKNEFLLFRPIECNGLIIEASRSEPLFGFCVSISNLNPRYPEDKDVTPEEIDQIAEKVCKLDYFTDEKRGNYICPKQTLKRYLETNMFVPQFPYKFKEEIAKNFHSETPLVKYSYEKGLFTLDLIPDDLKEYFNYLINIPWSSIEASERLFYSQL
jgi:hypothetical protein